MADLVTSKQEVIENIIALRRYKDGREIDRKFHDGLIRRGRLFAVCEYQGEYAFAPSRFAGYLSNTRIKHKKGLRDGRKTNPALAKIFGPALDENSNKPGLYNAIDAEFNSYCEQNTIEPAKIPNPRKYWLASSSTRLPKKNSENKSKHDDAIDDIGTDLPSVEAYVGSRYSRDSAVRAAVMKRARGLCEYCGKPGFDCADGGRYLECHHIIALANDDEDRMTNVIALCPNDHREAHFGKRRLELEREMIKKISKMKK